MRLQPSVVWGAASYEFRMQIRRPALWITFAGILLVDLLFESQNPGGLSQTFRDHVRQYPLQTTLALWAFDVNAVLPICIGPLLAGRLPRDRRTKVDEMFTSMPALPGARLAGKYLGSLLATLIPVILIFVCGVAYIGSLSHNALVIPLALLAFVAIALPGMLFVGAFSIAVPAIMWVPLYQFLFVCYWFWNTLWFHAELPNLGRTPLSPIGVYMLKGFYGYDGSSKQHPERLWVTPAQGVVSYLLLVALSIAVLIILDRYLAWRQARQ